MGPEGFMNRGAHFKKVVEHDGYKIDRASSRVGENTRDPEL